MNIISWKEYQDQKQRKILDELLDLLRIPSVAQKENTSRI
jgi:predicted Fe-S protein YdhL (DUF1289 family)